MNDAERMKSQVIAVVLTIAVAALLAAFLWWEQQQAIPASPSTSPPIESVQPLTAEPAARPPLAKPHSPPPADGLFRCDGPSGTAYQAAPCSAEARQVEVARGTFSVVDAGPRHYRRVSESQPRSFSGVGLIERGAGEGDRNERACASHERAIKQIDARARQGMGSREQERLRLQRKDHKDAMWQLKCGF